jgi:hypothetical protein
VTRYHTSNPKATLVQQRSLEPFRLLFCFDWFRRPRSRGNYIYRRLLVAFSSDDRAICAAMLRRPQSVPRVGSIGPSTLNVSVFSPQIWRCPKIQFSPRLRAQSRIHRPFVLDSGEHGHRKPEMLPTREESLRESSLRWLEVEYNGKSHGFDSLTLRDSCRCTRCIDPSTTQKLFDTIDIPTKIRAKDLHVNADGSFLVSWNDDIAGFENHRSYFPSDFLSGRDTLKAVNASIRENNPQILWHAASLEARRSDMTVKYDDYIADRRTLRHVIRQLYKYGIVFISDVPPISGSVASIGNRFGPLMRTIYGATWDVRSLPSAKNVADTSANLGFHMVSRSFLFWHLKIRISLRGVV